MPKPASALSLCAFRVAAFASDEQGAPSRLLVLPLGKHDARSRGKVICNQDTLTGLSTAQEAIKRGPRLALDFEHNTVPGTPAFLAEKEPKQIAAWGEVVATSAGVEMQNLEWTPAGLEAWKNKSFQDISPAVFRRADGTVVALHSVALCRHGELDGLTIEAARAPSSLAPLFAALSTSIEIEIKPSTMKPTAALIALLSALGVTLTETADEAATEAAMLEAAKAVEGMKSKEKNPEGMSADNVQLTALAAEVKTLKEQNEKREREALVAVAAAEGKVIPLSPEVIALTPLNVLQDIVKNAKAGEVPKKTTTPSGEVKQGQPEAFSADELEAFAAMGVTADQVTASLSK